MKKTIIIATLTTGAFLALGVFLFKLDQTPNPLKIKKFISESPQVGKTIPIQRAIHISNPKEHEPYNSNPPTSGPHLSSTINWGIYDTPLLDEQVLHSLEHGGIWISYKKKEVDEQTKINLKAIAKANSGSVILSPRPNNDSNIALASWGRLLKLESYDEQVILNFIRSNKNKSPEKLAF